MDGRTSPVGVVPPSTVATEGFRFCDCKSLPNASTATREGRKACAVGQSSGNCQYDPALYGSTGTNPWKKIRTPAGAAWSGGQQTGREWLIHPDTDFSVFWDFRQLGAAVTSTSHLFPYQGTLKSQSVKGVLWTTIRQLSPAVSGIANADVMERSSSLDSGDAYWGHKKIAPRVLFYTEEPLLCKDCPQGFQNPYYEISNPEWRMTPESVSRWMPTPDYATVNHYEQVAGGVVRHVPASEPFHYLARAFPDGMSFTRAVGVEGQAVTRVLNSTKLDALPVRASFSATTSGPGAATGRGYAFSASMQRLYVLGGVTGITHTVPTNEGWFLDLETGAWRQFAFPSGESVGTVIAATYRWQDQSIYFLDKSGSTLRLRRWNAQRKLLSGVVQTLATFPASWNAFSRYNLGNTPAGDVLLSAWQGTGTQKTWVSRVSVSEEGAVAVPGLMKSTTPIMAPPAAGLTGYTSVRRVVGTSVQEPYGYSVSFASMSAPLGFDIPTILPQ